MNIRVTRTEIDRIMPALKQAELLIMSSVNIVGEFYEMILKYCTRVKHLHLKLEHVAYKTMLGTRDDWLFRHYPTVEHLEIHLGSFWVPPFRSPHIATFFRLNPQIRTFTVDYEYLEWLKGILLEHNITFDCLTIHAQIYTHDIRPLANALYENNVYKQLQLYINDYQLLHLHHNFTVYNNLEKLHLYQVPEFYSPLIMESITELSVLWIKYRGDFAGLIMEKFVNLRRITIKNVRFYDIRSFAHHAPKLHLVRIAKIVDGDPPIASLIELNDAREKLARARKLTIEKQFLKLKWENQLNFSLIKFKRTHAHEIKCIHPF